MITVKIPAAIRVCSPLLALVDTAGGDICIPKGATVHAAAVESAPGGLAIRIEGGWFAPPEFALIISDPTGAAHLAWWLLYTAPRHNAAEHAERLAAIVAEAADYGAALDCAARGLGAKLSVRGLEILRDYAHRVAGVTNG